jgi:putative tryptophan/tyrosine transport system substrate-binding protein
MSLNRPARLLACSLLLALGLPSYAARIVVLQASDTPRLAKTLAAMQMHAGMSLDVVQLVNMSNEDWEATLSKGERPAVVVALGPLASDFVVRLPAGPPVVHCLAGADALRAGTPSLPSEVPADTQASWLRRLVPAAKTVGLAFDSMTNTRRAEAIAAALGAAGYKTLMRPVAGPSAIPAAIEQIVTRADVLLALPDSTVYTRESARGILLQSFRKGTPVIGSNDAWVRMGALYALDWDYDEVGAVCAQLAQRELQGPRSAIALPAPLKPRVSVNLRSAAQFGLRWDADLLRTVDVRHE